MHVHKNGVCIDTFFCFLGGKEEEEGVVDVLLITYSTCSNVHIPLVCDSANSVSALFTFELNFKQSNAAAHGQ